MTETQAPIQNDEAPRPGYIPGLLDPFSTGMDATRATLPSTNSREIFQPTGIAIVSKTGNGSVMMLGAIESFEYNPQLRKLFINLRSGRQHQYEDDRAYPLYLALCDELDIERDRISPPMIQGKASAPAPRTEPSENRQPRAGSATPANLHANAAAGDAEAARRP